MNTTIGIGTSLWEGILEPLIRAIDKEWKPTSMTRELEYRNDLLTFLRKKVPAARIESEYRHVGTTTDIYLRWNGLGIAAPDEIFIELKCNFKSKPECDRLIGQVEQLDPTRRHLIVVFCGADTNQGLVDRMEERYKKARPDFLRDGSLSIIRKLH